MKTLVLVFVLLLGAAARAAIWQITQPAVSGAGATANTYLEVWSPACATPVLHHRCNVLCANITLCPPTQHWEQAVLPAAANQTKCGFTFDIPPGDVAGPWQLRAVTVCA